MKNCSIRKKISKGVKLAYKKGLVFGFQKGNKVRKGMKNTDKQKRIVSKLLKRNNPMWSGSPEEIEKNKKSQSERIKERHKTRGHPMLGVRRLDMKGKKNYNWNNGVSILLQQVYHCPKYKLWRKRVFERDNYIGQEVWEKRSIFRGSS